MKIVKKPTFPIQKCETCGCEFKINAKDLKTREYNNNIKYVKCPICNFKQYPLFEDEKMLHNENL